MSGNPFSSVGKRTIKDQKTYLCSRLTKENDGSERHDCISIRPDIEKRLHGNGRDRIFGKSQGHPRVGMVAKTGERLSHSFRSKDTRCAGGLFSWPMDYQVAEKRHRKAVGSPQCRPVAAEFPA